MTVEIAPGPASIGMASGVTATSSFACPSEISAAPSCVDRLPCNMSMATSHRMRPPAIRKAGMVMPNSPKMRLPASANTTRIIAAATQARRAVTRRCAGLCPCVMTRYVGTTAIGSTMKSTDAKVTSANWT